MSAEEAPRREEERPRAVVGNIPAVVFALDRNGAFVLFEGRGLEALGFGPEGVVGRSVFEVCRGAPRVLDDVRRALAGEHVASSTEACGEALGSRYSPLRDEGGEVAGVVGVFADATGRTKEATREDDERFRSLVRYASDVITVLEADGTIRYGSPAVERVLGYRPEDLVGENAFRYIHPDDAERTRRAFADALGRPGAFLTPVEYRFRHADGSWRHLESVGNNLLEKASVGGVVVNSRDVTERKRAEVRLREAEERYRTLVEQIPAVTYIDRADGSYESMYTSPQLEAMLGYAPEEWRANGLWEKRLHPDDRARILAADERLKVGGKPFSEEYRLMHRDGRAVWVRDEAVPVANEAGEPLLWRGILFDITERKEAEEALRGSQVGLAEAQRIARLGSWEWDVVTGDLSWSDEVFRIYGYPPGRFVPTFERLMEVVHPEDRKLVRRSIDAALHEGEPYGFDHRIVLPDGTERVVHRQAEVVFDGEGRPLRMIGTVHDITGRKRAEDALREAEEKYRTLVERTPVVTYTEVVGGASVSAYVSPQIEGLTGYAPEELAGPPPFWQALTHPDDRERVLAEDERSNSTGEPFDAEYRMVARDGRVVWVRDEAVLVSRDEDGTMHWQGVISDITERKEAEGKLRESERRHRRQARELALLDRVRTAMARELDLPLLFRTVVEAIAETFGYALVSIYLIEDGFLTLQHQVGYHRVLDRVPLERGVMGGVARTGEPALIDGENADPGAIRAFEGISSEVCVPLRDGGRVVGVLNLESLKTSLTEDDLRLMDALGQQVGIAMGRARLYAEARESEERLRSLADAAFEGIVISDRGRILEANEAYAAMHGYRLSEIVGMSTLELVAPEHRARARRNILARSEEPYEVVGLRKDGTPLDLEIRGRAFSYRGRDVRVTAVRDVTERKRAEDKLREAEARYRTLVEHIPAVTYTHPSELGDADTVGYISPQIEALLGYAPEDFLRDPELWKGLLHPEDRERVLAENERTDETGEPFSMEYRFSARDGRCVWVRDEAVLIRGEKEEPLYWQGFFVDITERKALEERLEHRSLHDALTGLPNRALFMDRLRHARERADRPRDPFAVLFVDLDNFKRVNDSLGHEAGDRLLVAVSRRLSACLRPGDTVARLGGDEFTVLLENVADAGEATRVAERIAQDLRSAFALDGHAVFVTASIGIVLGTAPHASTEDLLRDADRAMYRAKEGGKARCEIFDLRMGARFSERMRLEGELRRAVEREEFAVHYRPEVSARTGEIFGFEALVRWERAEHAPVPPSEFVPLAEETGLIVPIGRLVLEEACRKARGWQARRPGLESLAVGVNLSQRQFRRRDLGTQVAMVLHKTGLAARDLVLGVTEGVAMEDAERTAATLGELRALGVRVAIGQFGTGHSSLTYLVKRFGTSLLKIDRSFVGELADDPANATMLSGIFGMTRALGMRTVVEGVETAEQLALLRELGADVVQGSYVAGPMTSDAVDELLDAAAGGGYPWGDRWGAPEARRETST